MKKRWWLLGMFVLLGLFCYCGEKKVLVLGVDGLDPNLLKQFMAEGKMPHFKDFIAQGDFRPLQTSRAPQSPIAWSNFITGMDPGGHGIYDFIHRDPESMMLEFSMSKVEGAARTWEVGSWVIPLSSPETTLLRKGKAFWEILGEAGISTTIFRIPVNFPPVEVPGNYSLSGMGTPDILGTPGTFSFYTTKLPSNYREISGGKAYKVKIKDGRIDAKLYGPTNDYRRVAKKKSRFSKNKKKTEYKKIKCTADFTVFVDQEASAIRMVVGDQEFILKEKEWSEWIPIQFEAVPWLVEFSAVCRFYLKQIGPTFQLYVSPLQINPDDPILPISNPSSWSSDLCKCLGYFYTQELPHDTKAFFCDVFTGREFWDQSMLVFQERCRALQFILETDPSQLKFFYFGTVDQGCHMLWHFMDEQHPNYVKDDFLVNGIRNIYQKMDDVLGTVLKSIDDDTVLIIMSDHGFAPFYWGVNLNTWLAENGYLSRNKQLVSRRGGYFSGVDWQKTKAYAVGLNGLYVNLKGREKHGAVSQEEYNSLLDELERDLLAIVDPATGRKPISQVTRTRSDFKGTNTEYAPDIIVGYSWGYRSSWENPLGEFTKEVFIPNMKAWSGDHCIDNSIVPGVLITNQKISMETPALYDLTVAILDEFGVKPLEQMIGKDCLAPRNSLDTQKQ
ncbi:MAG: hypothetical protein CSA81_11535 [Acidobacteria bacterium]|nr:MAG: hypothetical protein CSA81_11535 [Acidobacteriota bacterium]